MAGVRYIGIPDTARRIQIGDRTGEPRSRIPGVEDPEPVGPAYGETPAGMEALAPCIEREVTGRWRVAPMPSRATVQAFIELLAAYPAESSRLPPDAFRDWYQLYGSTYRFVDRNGPVEPSAPPTAEVLDRLGVDVATSYPEVHPVLPSEDWASALEIEEMVLVDLACRILGGGVLVAANRARKLDPSYVPVESLARPTWERLFDRLRVNFQEPDEMVRWPTLWSDRSGQLHYPKLTVFARRTQDNPYSKLRSRLAAAPGGGPLAKAVGLIEPPDTFPMPLQWAEAIWDALPPDLLDDNDDERPAADVLAEHLISLWNLTDHTAGGDEDDLIDRTRAFANAMQGVNTTAGAVLGWAGGISLISGMFLTLQIVVRAETQIMRAIDEIPALLRLAVEDGLPLNESLIYFLDVLRELDTTIRLAGTGEIELDSLSYLTGVDYDGLTAIMSALRAQLAAPTPYDRGPYPEPTVLIGDRFSDLARVFARNWAGWGFYPYREFFDKDEPLFNVGTEPPPSTIDDQAPAAAAWTQWWNTALPTVDMGILFEAIGTILPQLVKMDDLLLAVSDLAAAEGVLGAEVRSTLSGSGTGGGVDPLGGVNAADVMGFLIRQILTDVFIDYCVEQDGVDPACLYPLFAWTNTEEKRATITAALGEPQTPPDEEPWPAIEFALGFSPRIRAALLPESSPPVAAPTGPRSPADEPPLARVLRAADPLRADPCDLGRVRDWLYHARQSSQLDVRAALEPHWTLG